MALPTPPLQASQAGQKRSFSKGVRQQPAEAYQLRHFSSTGRVIADNMEVSMMQGAEL